MDFIGSVTSKNAPQAVGPYSQARWAGNILYLSGQIGMKADQSVLVSEDTSSQAKQSMKNIAAILKEVELGWQDVIKVNV